MRPFTKNSMPEGDMPDIPYPDMTKLEFTKEALAEAFRQMRVLEFRITNTCTERDIALAEVERMTERYTLADIEIERLSTIVRGDGQKLINFESEVERLKKELKRCQLDAFEEVDSRLKTGG